MKNTNKDMNKDENTNEPALDAAVAAKIAEHYHHAKAKHPYFADILFDFGENNRTKRIENARKILERDRERLSDEVDYFGVRATTLAKVECSEFVEALARGDKAAAVEECYDVIAVLLRMIDVLEGRQKLGKPKSNKRAD